MQYISVGLVTEGPSRLIPLPPRSPRATHQHNDAQACRTCDLHCALGAKVANGMQVMRTWMLFAKSLAQLLLRVLPVAPADGKPRAPRAVAAPRRCQSVQGRRAAGGSGANFRDQHHPGGAAKGPLRQLTWTN